MPDPPRPAVAEQVGGIHNRNESRLDWNSRSSSSEVLSRDSSILSALRLFRKPQGLTRDHWSAWVEWAHRLG